MSIFICLDFFNLNICRECNLFILILLWLVLNIVTIKISSWIWVSCFTCVLPSHLKKFKGFKLKVALIVLLFLYCSSISCADCVGMFQTFSFLSSVWTSHVMFFQWHENTQIELQRSLRYSLIGVIQFQASWIFSRY
jgi:hypothetical protein